jgi:hypothetical protein
MSSYKKKHIVKETSKLVQQEEIAANLYDSLGFTQSREHNLSKASEKAVKKRAAVI